MVGHLDLMAVYDPLREHPVFVADAVAESGQAESRHRIEEAGGKPAEAAVAERRLRFAGRGFLEIEAGAGKSLAELVIVAQRQQAVGKGSSQEKLDREVIDALDVLLVLPARRLHPPFDQPVAHHLGQRHHPVVLERKLRVLADRVEQPVGDRPLDRGRIEADRLVGKRACIDRDRHGIPSSFGCPLLPDLEASSIR
jgi:hypothetical protein